MKNFEKKLFKLFDEAFYEYVEIETYFFAECIVEILEEEGYKLPEGNYNENMKNNLLYVMENYYIWNEYIDKTINDIIIVFLDKNNYGELVYWN